MSEIRKRRTYTQQVWQPILRIASLATGIVAVIARAATTARQATPWPPAGHRPQPLHAVTGNSGAVGGSWWTAVEYYAAGSQGCADVTATTPTRSSQPSGPGYSPSIYRPPTLPTEGPRSGYTALRWTNNYGPSGRSAKPPAAYGTILADRGSPQLGPRMCAWLY
jgi:hypothetical protein